MSTQPQYLSPVEVAARLGTSRNTVHRAIARGDLPAVRYGRLIRIKRTDFDAFLAKHPAPRRRTA